MRILSTMAAVAGLIAAALPAQSLKRDEVLSSVIVEPLTVAHPVLGADNRVHLAYELAFTNPGKLFLTLEHIDVVAPDGKLLAIMGPGNILDMIVMHSGTGAMIAPGGSATLLIDVSRPPDERLPDSMSARITGFRQGVGDDGNPTPLPPDSPAPPTFVFTGAKTAIGQATRVIDPPLRGANWLATNGCCNRRMPHRSTVIAINGNYRVPERFAIDWIQLDSNDRAFEGDPKVLKNWAYYGAPVYSVAPGKVVNIYDGEDEQVPGPHPSGFTTEGIGGNMVVVDIGDGAYAFYAHLQRRSLKVSLGDYVGAGQVLGLLGNTGNSTAPHLHFHLMDGPSPLNANGIPFVLRNFSSRGTVVAGDEDALEEGKVARVDTNRLAGDHANQLPLDNQVVTFK